MARSRIEVERGFVVWVVAGISAATVLLDAVAAALNHDWPSLLVYATGLGAIFPAVVFGESLKLVGED